MIETISSSFSVIVIASPPSRGTMIPATKAPRVNPDQPSELQPFKHKNNRTENSMDANNICEESGPKEDHHGNSHEENSWAALD